MILSAEAICVLNDSEVDAVSSIFTFEADFLRSMHLHDSFWGIFRTMVKGGARKLIIDMKNLDFIDSIGISVLINASKLVKSVNGSLVITNISENVDTMLKPLDISRFFLVMDNNSEARTFLSGGKI
ncbi:MAG: STAS domain-containing protein [Spirochaetes bacterium]|nr:STAS domain-containing protein [Spirochaetota bacterium]